MKKRIISGLLALALAVGLLPATVLAADSASVWLTAQQEGAFLVPRQQVQVSSDLAEQYGFADSVSGGVSGLDVLVKAHEILLADAFTKDTAANFLAVAESGFVTKQFGQDTSASGFLLDGGYPTDGTESSYGGYNGTTATTQAVADGDLVDFFFYQDTSYYSDIVSWFCQGGTAIEEASVHGGVQLDLTLQGIMYMMGYRYPNAAAMHAAGGEAVEGAQLAWVDGATGELSDITGAVTDENGAVSVTAPAENGTYYLTAYTTAQDIADDAAPLILQLLPVTVDNSLPLPQKECKLSALSVATMDSNPDAVAISPAFDSAVTAYTAPAVGYKANSWERFFYVKAGAQDKDLVITARLGSGAWQAVASGDTMWKMIGSLAPGDNTLEVKVAVSSDEGAESKTYTVRIAMGYDPAGLTATLKNEAVTVGTENSISAVNGQGQKVLCDWTVSDPDAVTVLEGSDRASHTFRFVPKKAASGVVVTATALESTVTAQCALPDAVLPPADPETVLHTIAAKFAASGIASDPNAPWLAADMAAYSLAFPDSEHRLDRQQVQAYLDKLIAGAAASASPSVLAKSIIALRAMGYDARKVTTAQLETVDLVQKLTDLVDQQAKTVSNYYTLPYVLIALQQGTGYATQAQLDWLVEAALDAKSSWQDTSRGPDGAAPVILALAPYYKTNSAVKAAVDTALDNVKTCQKEDGSVGNAASTGLTMAAFAALGQDGPVTASGKTLTDGLMTQLTDDRDGFKPANNTFATEQGFRGLAAKALGGRVYDFAGLPMEPAQATWAVHCPVELKTIPQDASAEVRLGGTLQTPKAGKLYDLEPGTYTYTAVKAGYTTASGSFTVTDQEAAGHTAKTVSISLASSPSDTEKDVAISVRVLTHDKSQCGGKYTYKYNSSAYTTVIAQGTVTLKAGQSAFDALDRLLKEAGISYQEKSYGYLDAIGDETEFGHGSANSGWQYMVDGQLPTVSCRDYAFTKDAALVWYFTDDYTKEKDAEQFVSGGQTGGQKPQQATTLPFDDVQDHWGAEAIAYVYEKGLMEGTADGAFAPNAILDRAMLVTILWRLAGQPEGDQTTFGDVPQGSWYSQAVAWAQENGIVNGVTDTAFAPTKAVTREQAAAMLWRYAKYAGVDVSVGEDTNILGYTDAFTISEYAYSPLQWACGAGVIRGMGDGSLGAADTATRAQVAVIVMRFCEDAAK